MCPPPRGGHFHTIPSILKLSPWTSWGVDQFPFPYDSVYFKALGISSPGYIYYAVFPYDSVYFKAQSPSFNWRLVIGYFHTIPSILKPCDDETNPQGRDQFPYDSVYFKAPVRAAYSGFVYFYFHTIPSILKLTRETDSREFTPDFHTIPSILKLFLPQNLEERAG